MPESVAHSRNFLDTSNHRQSIPAPGFPAFCQRWEIIMALCKWNGGACDRETNHPTGICDQHRKMTPTIVASLAAGIIGTEHYGLYDNGEVFLFDAQGQKHKVQESLAEKVRAAIKAGESVGSEKH